MEVDWLVRRMTCRLPKLPEVESQAAADLARVLLDLPNHLPSGLTGIVGGSLGRGEPNFETMVNGQVASDVDLMFVYDGPVPPITLGEMSEIIDSHLADAGGLLMSANDYRRLPSSLGHDYKEGGIPLTDAGLPPWEPVSITPRDGFELFNYTLFLHTWARLSDQVERDGPDAGRSPLARLTMKVLRSAKMALGGYYFFDDTELPQDLQPLMEAVSPGSTDPPSSDELARGFFPVCRRVLEIHEQAAGRTLLDAIEGSPYVGAPGADFIAREHGICQLYFRYLFDRIDETDRLVTSPLRRAAWANVIEAEPWIVATPTYEDYLAPRKPAIQDQLLLMKVAVSRKGVLIS